MIKKGKGTLKVMEEDGVQATYNHKTSPRKKN